MARGMFCNTIVHEVYILIWSNYKIILLKNRFHILILTNDIIWKHYPRREFNFFLLFDFFGDDPSKWMRLGIPSWPKCFVNS